MKGECSRQEDGKGVLTASSPGAHSTIARVVGIPANIPHPRIQQSLLTKVPPKQVFYAPEAPGGNSTFFGVLGDRGGGGCCLSAAVGV